MSAKKIAMDLVLALVAGNASCEMKSIKAFHEALPEHQDEMQKILLRFIEVKNRRVGIEKRAAAARIYVEYFAGLHFFQRVTIETLRALSIAPEVVEKAGVDPIQELIFKIIGQLAGNPGFMKNRWVREGGKIVGVVHIEKHPFPYGYGLGCRFGASHNAFPFFLKE